MTVSLLLLCAYTCRYGPDSWLLYLTDPTCIYLHNVHMYTVLRAWLHWNSLLMSAILHCNRTNGCNSPLLMNGCITFVYVHILQNIGNHYTCRRESYNVYSTHIRYMYMAFNIACFLHNCYMYTCAWKLYIAQLGTTCICAYMYFYAMQGHGKCGVFQYQVNGMNRLGRDYQCQNKFRQRQEIWNNTIMRSNL